MQDPPARSREQGAWSTFTHPVILRLHRHRCHRSLIRFDCLTRWGPSPRCAPRGCPLSQCWDSVAPRSARPTQLQRALSSTRSPWEPGTAFRGPAAARYPQRSWTSKSCTRHPADGERGHARTRRCQRSASRIDRLTPEAVSAPRSVVAAGGRALRADSGSYFPDRLGSFFTQTLHTRVGLG
jgi:hypothetical protein